MLLLAIIKEEKREAKILFGLLFMIDKFTLIYYARAKELCWLKTTQNQGSRTIFYVQYYHN